MNKEKIGRPTTDLFLFCNYEIRKTYTGTAKGNAPRIYKFLGKPIYHQ